MPFPEKQIESLLVQCHRRCCICHRFCGVKMEIDHIVPRAEGGSDDIENAIALCFECHAEAHAYNDRHPRGRKFRAGELREHKQQWLKICVEHPQALLVAQPNGDVGPLQALVDELEYNTVSIPRTEHEEVTGEFMTEQFRRAISTGSISLLKDELKTALLEAYSSMITANEALARARLLERRADHVAMRQFAHNRMIDCRNKIESARRELISFLGHEENPLHA